MLTFVTAVRHPLNSSSYARVGRLLDATLRSVCRQTDADFRVVVVHNEMPTLQFSDARIVFVRVGFDAPSLQRSAEIGYRAGIIDKGAKLTIGFLLAREHQPSHVMFFDCDDLAHSGLAGFANARLSHPGWYSPDGYLHTAGTRSVQMMTPDFNRKCGSSEIIRTDLIPVPAGLSRDASKDEVIEAVGIDPLYRLLGSHGKWEAHLAPQGIVVEPLPFPSAVWIIGTGENWSGNLVSGRDRLPITPEVTEAFGLTKPSLATHFFHRIDIAIKRAVRRLRRLCTRAPRRPS